MFLHSDPALNLTQMILGAEQTCQPHNQPGHWFTWKDISVWLSFSQRNTHFYCFSLLLRFFWPRVVMAVPMQILPLAGQGLSKATQTEPWESLWGAEMPFPVFASTGIPQICISITLVQT